MNKQQVEKIGQNRRLPGSSKNLDIKETHISWLILYDHLVYKIKRPVNYSFVDFSSPEKRESFCREEIRLNSRLAPHMYLDVVEITSDMLNGDSKTPKEVVDYAVQMIRMDNDMEMDKLLKKD